MTQGDIARKVRLRAGGRCEYCRLPQTGTAVPFQIDHIRARQHKGKWIASNLAVACIYCNGYKGPNASGFDPATGKLTRLFHPRQHKWDWHFRFNGGVLIGRTAIGRTTIEVLNINLPTLVALREELLADGIF